MKDEYSRIEEIFFYIKDQFEIENFGRVISNSTRILNAEFSEFHYRTFELRTYSLLAEHQDEEAIKTLEQAIEAFPNDYYFRMNRVSALMDVGRFLEAQDELIWLNEHFPKNYSVIFNLAEIAMNFRDFAQAIKWYDYLLAFWTFDFRAMMGKALAKMELGFFDEAFDIYHIIDRNIGSETNDLMEYYNNLGYTHSRNGDFAQAKEYLELAYSYWPENPSVNDNLGYVLAQLGDVEQGLAYINTSIQLDERNSYAFKNRAKLYMMKQQWKLAKKDLEHAIYLGYDADYGGEVNTLLREVEMHLA